MRGIIAGIDPGITVGIALLDLYGRLIFAESVKNVGIRYIIHKIISAGRPVIIATDISPAPELVEKISAKFNADIYTPDRIITQQEKIKISKQYLHPNNSHIRDSLAAASLAYESIKKTIEKIDRKSELAGLDTDTREILRIMVLRHEFPNIDAAIREILEQKKIEETIKKIPEQVSVKRRKFYTLQRDYQILWDYKVFLENKVERLNKKIDSLVEKIKFLKNNRINVLPKDRIIRKMEIELKKIRHLFKQQSEKIKQLEAKNRDLLLELEMERMGFRRVLAVENAGDGDIVYVRDNSEFEKLPNKPLAIISPLPSKKFPVVHPDSVKSVTKRGFLFVYLPDIYKALDLAEKLYLEKLIENYQMRNKRGSWGF